MMFMVEYTGNTKAALCKSTGLLQPPYVFMNILNPYIRDTVLTHWLYIAFGDQTVPRVTLGRSQAHLCVGWCQELMRQTEVPSCVL